MIAIAAAAAAGVREHRQHPTSGDSMRQNAGGDGRRVVTCCHDTGPFLAHVVDGRWVRSTPLEPNLPVGHNAYAVRNRIESPDRIRYPMKRADFDPRGARNTRGRGSSPYVRISWDEALDLVARELERVRSRFGPSAICLSPISHQWLAGLHSGREWSNRFFSLLGDCTRMVGGTSFTGWQPGGELVWGLGFAATNNAVDLLKNTRLIIHWASDVAVKRYNGYRQNEWLRRFKEAGIRQIVLDPYFNDTAALYGDQWIPILPETDEALMCAIAHLWIAESLYDREFVARCTVGFEEFRSYVLGESDGTPKTPRWAAPICGVPEQTIRRLAREWASEPTYVLCDYGGANRRHAAAEWSRMIVTMQALAGNIGRPGRGLGGLKFATRGDEQRGIPRLLPVAATAEGQTIRHGQFADAVLNPPIRWSTVNGAGRIEEKRYPLEGCSPIRMMAFMSESGWFLNQVPGTDDHVRAIGSPQIEFVYCHAAWWHAAPKFSDVILPVRHTGERDDIVAWENYTVYSHAVVEPEGEPRNDMEILADLAERLGFGEELTMGKTAEQWLRVLHADLELPLSFEEFKQTGYWKYPFPEEEPQVGNLFAGFCRDPAEHRLDTPSGRIEIRSARVVDHFGQDHPSAPAVPKYLPSPEAAGETAARYPLLLTSPHAKMGRHSQWQNLAWHRDDYQMNLDGLARLMISAADAAARGIATGDRVRVQNARGSVLCAALVTERLMPGVLRLYEGGWYTPARFEGASNGTETVDVGGNPNVLISGRQPDPFCDGMLATARVQVTREDA
jgi:trimethylamine-N-oxide reductase (cytochrome c)